MKYAIFSDIHSNLEAYEAFLADLNKEAISDYICVGDIVGYGANPHECIEITRGLNCPIVCGNHDWAACSRIRMDYFNDYAKTAVLWSQGLLTAADKDFLKKLNPVYHGDKFTSVHGSLDNPQRFNYIFEVKDAANSMRLQKTQICFVGHSHMAGVFFEDKEGYIEYTTKPRVEMKEGRRYLVNAGSIGQPRDGDWRGSYCIYDDAGGTFYFKRIQYDLKKAQNKIIEAGLPDYLAERLGEGR